MKKVIWSVLLVCAACLVAGVFGMIHNQVSYTISPAYFHDFKFRQFAIADYFQNAIGASLVGWRASWWMGLFLSVPLIAVTVWRHDFVRRFLIGLMIVPIVAACCAAIGLGLGFAIGDDFLGDLHYASSNFDGENFYIAGLMHEASYLGGAAGTIIACLVGIFLKSKTLR